MSSRPLTVVVTDMEGSTAFAASQGDESAMEVIRTHERVVRSLLPEHRGREIKSMGDGFLLAFESPPDAIACALAIDRAFAIHNEEQPELPINVRYGVHAGPVIEEGGDIYGTTVNATSRIAAKAKSGQILVSDALRTEAASSVDCHFVDRGLFWLKGLREQWRLFEATHEDVAARPAITEGRTPFVDREAERAGIRMHVDNALEGTGSVLLLGGDSGSGKTRLADEMGAEAQGRGMGYLVGRCYETSQAQPYTPVIETLEALERRLDDESLRIALGEAAPEIARLLPHLRTRFPDIPPAAELPPDVERRFLFDSIRSLLAAGGAVRPLYVFWDDLHWADDATLAFLRDIASQISTLPLMIVCTYTYAEVTPARPLRATIEDLQRDRLVERYEVGVLRPEDIATLLDSMGDEHPPAQLVDVLYQQTEGNAFFFEEVVRHLLDSGQLFDTHGGWREDIGLHVPESIRITVLRRLESLSDQTRKVLMIAAIIGRAFSFELLEALSDGTEDDLLDALDEAEHARLIRSSSEDGQIRFRFGHELVRQTLIGETSLVRRQRLHGRVADAMETVYASNVEPYAADIAYHLEQGGRVEPERLVSHLRLAADRALVAMAYPEARRYLDHALELTPLNDHATRGALLERIAATERSIGTGESAIGIWTAAADEYEAARDLESVAQLCLDAGVQVAWWLRGRDAGALLRRGLDAIGDEDSPVRAGLLALHGALASQAGDYENGARILEEAAALADRFEDDRISGIVRYSQVTHHFGHNEYVAAAEHGEKAIAHLRRAGDLWNLSNALGYTGTAYFWHGRFTEAEELGNEGADLAMRIGNWSAWVFSDRARIFRRTIAEPDFAWYGDDGRKALQIAEEQGFRWLAAIGYTRIGLSEFWQGRWEEALNRFQQATQLEGSGASGGHAGALILVNAHLGRQETVLGCLAEYKHLIDEAMSPVKSMTANSVALVAIEAYALLGMRDEAAALYPVAKESIDRGLIARGWDVQLLQTIAGISATCARDWNRAEGHFVAALEQVDSMPNRLYEGDACRYYADLLTQRAEPGDVERATALLDRAIAAYSRLEMTRHRQIAEAQRAQIA